MDVSHQCREHACRDRVHKFGHVALAGRRRSSQLQRGHGHVVPHSPKRPSRRDHCRCASPGNERPQGLQRRDPRAYSSSRTVLSFGNAEYDEPECAHCARHAAPVLDRAGRMAVGRAGHGRDPLQAARAEILYPAGPGIDVHTVEVNLSFNFRGRRWPASSACDRPAGHAGSALIPTVRSFHRLASALYNAR